MPTKELCFTKKELMAELQCSAMTIQRMIQRGLKIQPLVPGGRRYVVFKTDLVKFLNDNSKALEVRR